MIGTLPSPPDSSKIAFRNDNFANYSALVEIIELVTDCIQDTSKQNIFGVNYFESLSFDVLFNNWYNGYQLSLQGIFEYLPLCV